MKRIRVTLLVLLVALVGVGLVGSLTAEAGARFTYDKCGPFTYKGKHMLFTHRLPCGKAERKARYVLRHRHHPPHWHCLLAELSSGFAACHRGERAWEFVPR